MPYIRKEERKPFNNALKEIEHETILSSGSLNYLITKLCNIYLKEAVECYKTYNEIIGVLECAKQEYYRKIIAPYEDIKEKENGDLN